MGFSFARMGHPVGVAGVTWQITPEKMDAMLNDPDKAKGERVMNAMMGMVKLDIAELERAFGFESGG